MIEKISAANIRWNYAPAASTVASRHYAFHSIVKTNTCTTFTGSNLLKTSKKLLHVSVYDHHQGDTMSLPKSLII